LKEAFTGPEAVKVPPEREVSRQHLRFNQAKTSSNEGQKRNGDVGEIIEEFLQVEAVAVQVLTTTRQKAGKILERSALPRLYYSIEA
jgi:hypothetical protein